MMKSTYTVKIKNPCTENWNKMDSTIVGKFCSNCFKNVIDFSQLNEFEIVKVLEKSKGELCGKFSNHQLEKGIFQSNGKVSNPKFSKIIAGVILMSNTVNASEITNLNKEGDSVKTENSVYNELNSNVISSPSDSLKYGIRGRVLEAETNEPMVFVTVSIPEMNLSAQTSVDGYFYFPIVDSLIKDSFTLTISDYNPKNPTTINILKKDLSNVNIQDYYYINEDSDQESVGIIMGAFEYKKKKWWQRKNKID